MKFRILSALLLCVVVLAAPARAAQTAPAPSEDEIKKIVEIKNPAERAKALRAFLDRKPTGMLNGVAHLLLTLALLDTKAPTQEILDEAKTTLAALPADDPRVLGYRLGVIQSVAELTIQRNEGLDGALGLIAGLDRSLDGDARAQAFRPVLFLLTAQIQARQGKQDLAIATLKQALALDPDNYYVLSAFGDQLRKADRTDEAIDAYIQAEASFTAKDPDGRELRHLYTKKHGSLDGLDGKLALAREASIKRVALDSRRVDKPSPDWQLKDLAGQTVKLSGLKGQVVVLDFWATWCGPCRDELPIVEAVHQATASKGVKILGINCDGYPDRSQWDKGVRDYVSKTKMTFPVLTDFDSTLNEAYGIDAFPTIVVIDKTGTIRYRNVGFEPKIRQILTAQIESLLK